MMMMNDNDDEMNDRDKESASELGGVDHQYMYRYIADVLL